MSGSGQFVGEILAIPSSNTLEKLRSILGLVLQIGKFIPSFAQPAIHYDHLEEVKRFKEIKNNISTSSKI